LEAVATSGLAETFGPVRGRAPARVAAKATALYQNWPNPARDKTTIRYELQAPGEATLAVYDLSGRRVKTLASGPATAGVHDISWELTDEGGARVAPGVYLYRLTGGGETLCRRLVAAP
jgi:flagellar hook assembly protein FlgD